MNTMLGVLLALAVFVTFCDAICYMIPLEVTTEHHPKGCKDNDNVMHKFNSTWKTKFCEKCSCQRKVGIQCCSNVRVPLSYDQKRCQKIFHSKSCRYNVVMKSNPQISCKVSKYMD